MTTIPAEKFEEWLRDYDVAYCHCKSMPCDNTCVLRKFDNCYELTEAQYLSIKSKEYMEANQWR